MCSNAFPAAGSATRERRESSTRGLEHVKVSACDCMQPDFILRLQGLSSRVHPLAETPQHHTTFQTSAAGPLFAQGCTGKRLVVAGVNDCFPSSDRILLLPLQTPIDEEGRLRPAVFDSSALERP